MHLFERGILMKCRNFYCQLDYEHIPYPSPSSPYGNLANNGCGVCCGSMVIEALKGISFPPEVCAVFSKQSGAREGFGTDMSILAPALANQFDLKVTKTTDEAEVLNFLSQHTGLVIANTAGDREGWTGVFSDSRHYIVVADACDTLVEVWDPMYTVGRYETQGRKGKVRVDGKIAYADFSVVVNDCNGRPYYLFEVKDEADD